MYNTILGALPLQSDGRTFYYSDYNLEGKKIYSNHRWPCCSGTMPQVAADYRINAYFRDGRDVFVNLYIPSTARWTQDGTQISLTQESEYPYDSHVELEVGTSKAATLAVNLRIPSWAEGASVSVNGKREAVAAGIFARVQREWKSGDRIELELPMQTRLEAIDAQHPDTVAVLVGPLVLFGDQVPGLSRSQLLAAKTMARGVWHVSVGGDRVLKMVSWKAISENEPYSTYLRVT